MYHKSQGDRRGSGVGSAVSSESRRKSLAANRTSVNSQLLEQQLSTKNMEEKEVSDLNVCEQISKQDFV